MNGISKLQKLQQKNEKIFLVINLSCFGDILLTNTLCQNIKKEYPNSKVVFLVNKPFEDAALYQKDVDEVLVMDKRGQHKGLIGLLKFAVSFPYRNKVLASFIIYGNDRGTLLASLIGSKYRISSPRNYTKYLLTHLYENKDNLQSVQDINGDMLSILTHNQAAKIPIEYLTDEINSNFVNNFAKNMKNNEVIGLCAVCENSDKNMPLNTAIETIKALNLSGKKVLFLGNGCFAREYADQLKKTGCADFIDLTNITSISELARVIQVCQGIISIDTGTMHLAYAVGTPVVSVFYQKDWVSKWAPRNFLYKSKVIYDDFSAQNIINNLKEIISTQDTALNA